MQIDKSFESLLTIDDLSRYLRRSRQWIWLMRRREKLPYIQIGRVVMFRREEVDKWLDRRVRNVDVVREIAA
ncbi:MAG TPA: helix-turn-helix domain-containing protein [Pyrinomonadaceae bacterium]|nr:helix-turn-helix domain-containing protein [Pyrinomonadaceae bacterium]HMP65048.1 helix-turn-helix domain-containing protein [Pyrinomonadaceae bacterium]